MADPAVQTTLQRHRKALLADLSALVKLSKSRDATGIGEELVGLAEAECTQLVLAAFKVATRAVRFHDSWMQATAIETRPIKPNRPRLFSGDIGNVPPTPPSDSGSFEVVNRGGDRFGNSPLGKRTTLIGREASGSRTAGHYRETTKITENSNHSIRSAHEKLSDAIVKDVQKESQKRQSMYHRLSWQAKSSDPCKLKLASERLIGANETFLSSLSVFLGVHLTNITSNEILVNTQQTVNAGRDLLTVVEAVWDSDLCRSKRLEEARESMYEKITNLYQAAKHILQPIEGSEQESLNASDRKQLAETAMFCVKGAAECVDATRRVLELIGDFEFETINRQSLLSGTHFQASEDSTQNSGDIRTSVLTQQFPLPPDSNNNAGLDSTLTSPSDLDHPSPRNAVTEAHHHDDASLADCASIASLLPPPPSLTDSGSSLGDSSPLSVVSSNSLQAFQSDTSTPTLDSAMMCAHLSTEDLRNKQSYVGNGSWAVSEDFPKKLSSEETRGISVTGTQAPLLATSQELEEVEADVSRKTFAHELIFNKEGQLAGGTLPALVERLTTSDATPDALFVGAFFLTFRLFASPDELATALVDRYHYCIHDKFASGPVTLRVYNIFKGWLESHWQPGFDAVALPVIVSFAREGLSRSQPGASKRLLDQIKKVSEADPSTTSTQTRLLQKSTLAVNHGDAAEPSPIPVITKGQVGFLRAWKSGSSAPSILDFEPLELARQLTVKASNIFCSIAPEELLAGEWTKRSGSIAHNVRAMSTLSTDLTNLVADNVLQYEDHNKRAKIIKHWVKIACRCLDLNNYDSLMAIVCSLNSTPIMRLKKTWDCVSAKTKASLNQLRIIVDCSKNYSALRLRLSQLMPPCLPFLGMYLTDLTFVDAGNSATRELSTPDQEKPIRAINFDKHFKTARMIADLQRFQVAYNLREVPELQAWLQEQFVHVRSSVDSGDSPVNKAYRRSCKLEPREQIVPKSTSGMMTFSSSQIPRLQRREGEFMGISWR